MDLFSYIDKIRNAPSDARAIELLQEIVAAEREECAKDCIAHADRVARMTFGFIAAGELLDLAAAIRARR